MRSTTKTQNSFKIVSLSGFLIISFILPFLSLILMDFLNIQNESILNNISIVIKIFITLVFIYVSLKKTSDYRRKKFFKWWIYYSFLVAIIFISRFDLTDVLGNIVYKDIILLMLWPLDIYVLYYFYTVELPRSVTVEIITKLLLTIYGVSIFSIIYMIISDINQIHLFKLENFSSLTNFSGYFANRNSMGQLLYIFLVIFIIYKDFYVKTLGINQYRIALIIQFGAMLLTMSRASLLSFSIFLFISSVILIYFYLKKDNKSILYERYSSKFFTKKSILKAILFVLILTFLFKKELFIFLEKFLRINNGLSGRLQLWEKSLVVSRKHRFLGVGQLGLRFLLNINQETSYQPHNFYIDTLGSGGIITLLAFLSVFVTLIIITLRASSKKKYYKGYMIIAFFLSFLIYLNFESFNFFGVGFQPSLTISLSIIFILSIKEKYRVTKEIQ